jgi:hypothetical protein
MNADIVRLQSALALAQYYTAQNKLRLEQLRQEHDHILRSVLPPLRGRLAELGRKYNHCRRDIQRMNYALVAHAYEQGTLQRSTVNKRLGEAIPRWSKRSKDEAQVASTAPLDDN